MTNTELPTPFQDKLETIVETTKRGFDVEARLKNRGLRKGSITLYLDEELGAEIGYALDQVNDLGVFVGRARSGIAGQIDELEAREQVANRELQSILDTKGITPEEAEEARKVHAETVTEIRAERDGLAEKRDALVEELGKTGIQVKARAVPPVIEKDMKRRAKQSIEWNEKGLPAPDSDEAEAYKQAHLAHLMSALVQEVVDCETGSVNQGLSYEEAVTMIGWLPTSQLARLDMKLGEIQYMDAISREIESQEDFS